MNRKNLTTLCCVISLAFGFVVASNASQSTELSEPQDKGVVSSCFLKLICVSPMGNGDGKEPRKPKSN